MNEIVRRAGPALLGLIVAFTIGCSDSGTVFLDGQAPLGDVGIDQLAHKDTVVADTKPTDTQTTDAQTTDTAPTQDAVVASDGNTGFPQALDGIWLVGWIGGLNRFSWIKFTVTSKAGGTAIIQKGTLTSGTVPYWNCSGSTTWNITAKPNTIQLHYPDSLCTGMKSGSFTFTSIAPFTGTYPKGAQFVAAIQALTSTPATVSGYKFPPSQCDATLTTCKDPL
jgi:hypothetical protein